MGGPNFFRAWRKFGTAAAVTSIDAPGTYTINDGPGSKIPDSQQYCSCMIRRSGAVDPIGTVGYLGLLMSDVGDASPVPVKIPGTDFTLPTMAASTQYGIPVRFVPQGRLCLIVTNSVGSIVVEVIQ